jgi:hypothetical protein
MAQVVKCLAIVYKALGLIPSTGKKGGRKEVLSVREFVALKIRKFSSDLECDGINLDILAVPQCPGIHSNIIPDVSVKLFF